MVWGAFGYNGVGRLHPVEEGVRVGGKEYVAILSAAAKQSATDVFDNEPFVFQQDNAPGHTAILAKKWFASEKIRVLDWPGQSPDMNPIENLWGLVQHSVSDKLYRNKYELLGAIVKAWKELPVSKLQALVDSMPRRVAAVISAGGGSTRY